MSHDLLRADDPKPIRGDFLGIHVGSGLTQRPRGYQLGIVLGIERSVLRTARSELN